MRKRRREAAGEGIAYGADQLPRWRPALESPRHTPRPCLHSHIVYSSRYIQFVTCPIQKCCTVHTVHTYGPNCRSVWQAAGVLGDSLWTGMGVPRHSLLAPAPSPDTVGWWGVLVASVADAALLVDAAAGRGGVLTTQTTLHREVLDFLAPPSTRGGRSPLADLSSSVLSEGRMVMDALTAAGAPSGKTIDLVPGRHSTPLDVAARLPAAVAACDVFPPSEAFFNAAHCDGLRLVRCSGGGVDHRREPDRSVSHPALNAGERPG